METKKCPFCAEDINKEAIKCKHCGEFLNSESQDIGKKEVLNKNIELDFKGLYKIPVWKFIFYNILSIGVYQFWYISTIRVFLEKNNKIESYKGVLKFLGFKGSLSTIINGINSILEGMGINKKLNSFSITIFNRIFIILTIMAFKQFKEMKTFIPVYIFAFLLGLSVLPLLNVTNKYLAKSYKKSKKNLFQEIVLVGFGLYVMISLILFV